MTVAELMAEPPAQRDLVWLKEALHLAVLLELATLPPYLTAHWTIKNSTDPVARSLKAVTREEMLHFGLACNLLVAIGGTPTPALPGAVPSYPGCLPGGIRPELLVALRRLSIQQARVFMDIEYPQGGPVAATRSFDSIGAFYEAVRGAFRAIAPPLSADRQLEGDLDLFKIDSLDQVDEAIALIERQGEGSRLTPEDTGPGDLAHYYRFAEMHHGRRLEKDPVTGVWAFTGAPVPLPDTWPMADVPPGGYRRSDVPDAATWDLIEGFDRQFTTLLQQLQSAWGTGDAALVEDAVDSMVQMRGTALALMQRPRPDGDGHYGPCFRLRP